MDRQSKQELFDNFDAETYVARLVSGENENREKYTAFLSDWMYHVFSKGYIKGDNLLDIGTGSNVNSVIYATKYFNNIYLSDFSKNNRTFLEEWLDGSHRKLKARFFKEAVQREGNIQTYEEKERELLSKINGILYCDATQQNPLVGCPETVPKLFDAIVTCWCVNNAAQTVSEFEKCISNICSLIKPGGYLVLMGVNKYKSSYKLGGVRYPSACFDLTLTRNFFETSQMEMVVWEYADYVVPFGELYNVVARIRTTE